MTESFQGAQTICNVKERSVAITSLPNNKEINYLLIVEINGNPRKIFTNLLLEVAQ
jgi:hypothetical protein